MNRRVMTDSEFSMWRAVFAFAFADSVLSLEEQELLQSYISRAGFSEKQIELLKEDMHDPQSVVDMYLQITDDKDKKRFCVLARALAWCEGDMDRQEKEILKRVSCFGEPEHADILYSTRGDAHIKTYYQEYAKSGMAGIMKLPHKIELSL
jgi:hypothetical protein